MAEEVKKKPDKEPVMTADQINERIEQAVASALEARKPQSGEAAKKRTAPEGEYFMVSVLEDKGPKGDEPVLVGLNGAFYEYPRGVKCVMRREHLQIIYEAVYQGAKWSQVMGTLADLQPGLEATETFTNEYPAVEFKLFEGKPGEAFGLAEKYRLKMHKEG